jgi:hypothetical protein
MGSGGVAYGVAGHGETMAPKATRIYACVTAYKHAMSRISPTKPCPKGSRKISWSITGPAGARGAQGPVGADGATGSAGAKGADGAAGPTGPDGARGPAGPDGARGADGARGPVGPAGADGVSEFAEFFAIAPPDNSTTVAPGTDVSFPQNGPSVGSIQRISPFAFNLSEIGVYRVSFSVPVSEPGQLELTLNGGDLAYTVVGRASVMSSISGTSYVETTTINSMLTVRNPAGNSAALTVTPLAGGVRPVASTLTAERLS